MQPRLFVYPSSYEREYKEVCGQLGCYHREIMDYLTSKHRTNPGMHGFVFATGIENSYPTITGRDGKSLRVDEMDRARHYDNWREDLGLVREMGLEYLRYGPPYYKTHTGPGKYDWSFTDETFAEMRRLGIMPIADLCHFGVPDWIGNFQNPDWPALFAEYARAFAQRYPWVRLYTPVNEIFVCARFSARLGWWNERLATDQAYVTALKHMVQANILAEEAILEVQPRAYFIQSESSEHFHAATPDLETQEIADHLNHQRFISLDLCYGHHEVCWCSYEYLLDHGMSRQEFHWCMRHGRALRAHQVMGTDYYVTNEHIVHSDGTTGPAGDLFGYYLVTKQYYERYHLPIMHTETNWMNAEGASTWLWKQWTNVVRLKQEGIPIVGFTWYSLTDQIDWDTALREDNGTVNSLGLYDLDRKMRPVGENYKRLVAEWNPSLAGESIFLDARRSELVPS